MKNLALLLQEAVRLHQQGKLAEAERLYDKVLKADKRNADALNLKGVIAKDAGRLDEALGIFDRLLRAHPKFATAHFNLALTLEALGRDDQALAAYDRAVASQPRYADALLNRGLVLYRLGRRTDAIEAFRAMSIVCPQDPRGFYNLGACLEKSLPTLAEAQRQTAATEGLIALGRASALAPSNPDTYFAIANILSLQGDYAAAVEKLQIALKLRPHWAEAWSNLAAQFEALGDRERAVDLLDHALKIAPGDAAAEANRSMTLLALGRFDEGWKGLARRFDDPAFPFRKRSWPWPLWQGEDLRDRRILIWGDQGLGDELLYGSMIPDLAARAGECVVECDPRLLSLYRRSFPTMTFVSAHPEPDNALLDLAFDFQCSIIDAGRYLRRGFGAFPNRRAGLIADAEKTHTLREKYLSVTRGNMLVGVSWRSINPTMGHQKSVALEDFLPLFRKPGITFVSLQYGSVTEDIDSLRQRYGVEIIDDPTIDSFSDLDAFAAQICALDAVVTVSNTTVHFGGALNVPTYVYVPNGRKRIWYWFDSGRFSPWYRSVRVVRSSVEHLASHIPIG